VPAGEEDRRHWKKIANSENKKQQYKYKHNHKIHDLRRQNRRLRGRIDRRARRVGHGGAGAWRSRWGNRVTRLLERGFRGHGKDLKNHYAFGVVARSQKGRESSFRVVATLSSNNMREAYESLKNAVEKEIAGKRTGEMFMLYAETGPLFCSVPSRALQCRQMFGYALTKGLIKPHSRFINAKRAPGVYYLLRRRSRGTVTLRRLGTDLARAKEAFARATKGRGHPRVALLDSNARLVEKTVTDPRKTGDARYCQIFGSIGLYHTSFLHLYTRPIKSEAAAGLS